jgi:hypothetical protein
MFFGIVVRMYFNDHSPPHFHAYYHGEGVVIDIETLTVLEGSLSNRALSLVKEWAAAHRDELNRNWNLARAHMPIDPIQPLE